NAERLLRGVAELFFAGRADNRMPPRVGRKLSARSFFRTDETWRHVGNPIDRICVEEIVPNILGIKKNVVVLRRPLARRARPVVVGPNNLVQEIFAAEDLVEQNLAVMHLAVIDVKVETSRSFENPLRMFETGAEKTKIVVEAVAERGARHRAKRPIAPSAKPRA